MGRKLVTDQESAELCRRYEAGEPPTQLAKTLGINITTLYDHLRRHGITLRKNSPLLTDEQIAEVCRRYQEGENTYQLAGVYGVSYNFIRSRLMLNGVKIRSTAESVTRLNDSQVAELCRRYKQGEKIARLCEAFNLSSGSIHRYLISRGVENRHRLRLTDEQIADVCRQYEAGKSSARIAAGLGLSSHSILRVLKRQGIKIRRSGWCNERLTAEQIAEIKRLHRTGASAAKLAGVYNVSIDTIRRHAAQSRRKVRKLAHGLRALSDAQIDEMVRRYEAGERTKKLAEDFGVTDMTVTHWLRRSGVTLRGSNKRLALPDSTMDEICRAYQAGQPASQIAKTYGFGAQFIIKRLKQRGINVQRRGHAWRKFSDELIDELVAAYQAGESLSHLAKKFEMNADTAASYLKQRGVTTRPRHDDNPATPTVVFKITAPDGRFFFGSTVQPIKRLMARSWNDWIEDIRAVHPEVQPRIIAEGVPAYMATDIEVRMAEAMANDLMSMNRREKITGSLRSAERHRKRQRIHDAWLDSLSDEQRQVVERSRRQRAGGSEKEG